MKFHLCLYAAALGLSLVAASPAFATAISGGSGGSFSTLTGCDKNGSDRECGIVSSSNGTNTQVRWPYLDHNHQIDEASSLTSIDTIFNAATDANDVVIARLDWYNAATSSSITPDSLDVTWTLTISFTNPNLSVDTEAFVLAIVNPTNPTGDTISGFALADLGNLSFNLDSVIVDDFRYAVLDGSGNCAGIDTSLSGASWYNCENNNASLLITADFTAPHTGGAVPEPATLTLWGAGLLGLAAIRRRKSRLTLPPIPNERTAALRPPF